MLFRKFSSLSGCFLLPVCFLPQNLQYFFHIFSVVLPISSHKSMNYPLLQYKLYLLTLIFHQPAAVQAGPSVSIKSLPVSLVSPHRHPALGSSSPSVTRALHPPLRDTSVTSLVPELCYSGLSKYTLGRWGFLPQKAKALSVTQEVSHRVCFYGYFYSSYYTLDLEQILTIAHNCRSLALHKSSSSKYAAGEE